MSRANYANLTEALIRSGTPTVVMSWSELERIVGGLPPSATRHYPQWWHGDRAQTRAWRRAGYELASVDLGRSVTFTKNGVPHPRHVPATRVASSTSADARGAEHLADLDPERVLLVIGCSKEKALGGRPNRDGLQGSWPSELHEARTRVLARSRLDGTRLLPAWRRYTGTFYQSAGDALRDTASHRQLVIISGGYGLVRADEEIGWYDRKLCLGDWPAGLLERLLIEEAQRVGANTVVGFLSRTSDYARLLRRTPWQRAGISASLVTVHLDGRGGAQILVPRSLGEAFTAFWERQSPECYSGDVVVERMA